MNNLFFPLFHAASHSGMMQLSFLGPSFCGSWPQLTTQAIALPAFYRQHFTCLGTTWLLVTPARTTISGPWLLPTCSFSASNSTGPCQPHFYHGSLPQYSIYFVCFPFLLMGSFSWTLPTRTVDEVLLSTESQRGMLGCSIQLCHPLLKCLSTGKWIK